MFSRFLKQNFILKTLCISISVLSFIILTGRPIEVAEAADNNTPNILSRSTWDNTKDLNDLLSWIPDRKNTEPPDYAKVERIVVHDTGCTLASPSCNSDTVDQVAVIQSIYRSHTIFRGWGDIGYNYIIDRQGNIYEGRFGGNGVRAAHTYYDRKCMNFNVGTAGIVLLGNYSQQDMPEIMYKSLAKLVAWISANNNIKPDDLSRTTPVWFNPKKENGKCDMSSGSFGTAFTGPSVAGHGDVEAGNPDPGVVNLGRIRAEGAEYYNYYKKNVYRAPGINSYWIIENGERTDFLSEDKLRAAGYADYSIKDISASQLEFYPLHSSYKHPDGTLIRGKDSQKVYMVEEGKRRPLNLTADEFIKLGFKWDQVVILINKDMSLYPDGEAVNFASPEGDLVTDASGKVYRLENGRRRWITSLSLFLTLEYKWENVKKLPNNTLYSWLEGAWMTYPDNTLVKGSESMVYLVKGQEKHAVTSLQLFDSLKFKWTDVKSIIDSEVDSIKEGAPLAYADGSLVKTPANPDIYYIQDKKKHLISSDTLFKKLNYKIANVLNINNDEMSAIAAGEPVKYPSGNLLQAAGYGEIYVVENDSIRWIKTPAEFEKKGYRQNQVVSIKPEELAYYTLRGDIPRAFTLLPKPPGSSLASSGNENSVPVSLASAPASSKSKVITITSTFLRVRSTFSTKGKILGQVKKGEKYSILDENNGWYKIKTSGGIIGWVSGEYVSINTPVVVATVTQPTASIPAAGTIKISSSWLRVRSLPSVKGDILGMVNYGEVYQFTEKNNGWYKIKTSGGIIGWVSGEYTVMVDPEAVSSVPVSSIPKPVENPISIINSNINSNENTASSYNNNDEPTMRVAIYSPQPDEKIEITANGAFTVKKYNIQNILVDNTQKSKDEVASAYYSKDEYWRFEPANNSTIMKVVSYNDIMSWNTSLNDNEYRGIIEVKYSAASNKLWVINELPLEDYVDGIGEASNGDYSEYLKAFSLAARTYAKYYIDRGGKYKGEPFYLKNSRNGNGNDQLYRGYGFEKRAPNIVKANSATRGQIITFKSKPIVAAYSSDSGGVTKNACVALTSAYCNDDNYSYLRGGVSDPPATIHNPASVAASHGAGMSAVGARQMAIEGKKYDEIIGYYYLGVKIDKLY